VQVLRRACSLTAHRKAFREGAKVRPPSPRSTRAMNAAQLADLETWCELMFTSKDPAQQQEAQRRIVPLGESAEFIPACQHIMEHSRNNYALMVGAQSLMRLITTHWTSFTVPQRIEIRTCAAAAAAAAACESPLAQVRCGAVAVVCAPTVGAVATAPPSTRIASSLVYFHALRARRPQL
jgi:hypothetical protein